MRIILAVIVVLCTLGSSFAQNAKLKRLTAPLAGTVVLKDVEDKYNANVYSLEMPEPDADVEQEKLRAIKRYIAEQYPHKQGPAKKKTSSVVAPIVGINFVADSFSGIPPDNCMAVSRGYKGAAVMNSNIAVHDAATGAYLYRKSLKSFTSSIGLNSGADYRFDPKVLYDQEADRFISIILNGSNSLSNWVVIGFSQSNDPAGTWKFYKFFGNFDNDTTWFDYPAFAITKDELFFTGNQIKENMSWQAGFTRTVIYQVKKADGYAGAASVTYNLWDSVQHNGRNLRCLHPVTAADALIGPSQYFLSNRNFDVSNDTVFMVKVPDTIGSIDTILTVTPLKSSTIAYGVPPDARQPDTSATLATNDGRILGGIIKGDQIQFVSVSLNTANGNSAIYHGIINNIATASTYQAQLFGIDSLDLGYPNISYSGAPTGTNHSIISFEFSGPNTNPGLGAALFDGSAYSDMVVVKKGDGSIKMLSQKQQRWGDYSPSQPDWTIGGAVWVGGIFGRTDRTYGNYMAQLTSPYHAGTTTTVKRSAPAKVYPNPSWEYISLEFSVVQEQPFSFFVYDLQGRLLDKVTDQPCHEGQNLIRFNIAPLAPGSYVLKAIGADGESISRMFERK